MRVTGKSGYFPNISKGFLTIPADYRIRSDGNIGFDIRLAYRNSELAEASLQGERFKSRPKDCAAVLVKRKNPSL